MSYEFLDEYVGNFSPTAYGEGLTLFHTNHLHSAYHSTEHCSNLYSAFRSHRCLASCDEWTAKRIGSHQKGSK